MKLWVRTSYVYEIYTWKDRHSLLQEKKQHLQGELFYSSPSVLGLMHIAIRRAFWQDWECEEEQQGQSKKVAFMFLKKSFSSFWSTNLMFVRFITLNAPWRKHIKKGKSLVLLTPKTATEVTISISAPAIKDSHNIQSVESRSIHTGKHLKNRNVPMLFVELHHISRKAVHTTFIAPNSKIFQDWKENN